MCIRDRYSADIFCLQCLVNVDYLNPLPHCVVPNRMLHLSFYLKGKGLDTWYSTAYTELTHDQQRFTVTEVATDRQETILKIVHGKTMRQLAN